MYYLNTKLLIGSQSEDLAALGFNTKLLVRLNIHTTAV